MDRTNLGQEILASFSASQKTEPVQGLSKPRFLKQRKHSANSRGRPAASASQDDSAPGFSPFRSEKLDAAPLYQAEDSGAQKVREQLYGCNPFIPVASSCANSGAGYESSSNTGPGSIQTPAFDLGKNGDGNAGTGLLLFESGMEKDSSLRCLLSQKSSVRSLGSADSSISEGALNAGSFSDSNVESIETGIAVDASVCSASAGNVFSDRDVFKFGSSSEKYGNLHHRSSLGSDDGSFSILNVQKLESGSFVFKSGQMKSTHSSNNSSFGSGEGFFSEQSERTKKADQKNSSYQDCQKADMGVYVLGGLGKTKAYPDQSSSMCFHESSFPDLSEDLKKLEIVNSGNKDPDVEKKSTNASKYSSFGSFDSMFSKLPEKMEKLNLQNSADEDHREINSIDFVPGCSLEKGTNFNQTFTSGLDEGAFSNLHGELKKLNLQTSGNEHVNANNDVFEFGTSIKRNSISGKSSSLCFEESSFSKLPDEIGKMKLSTSGNEDNYQKTKQGDPRMKHRKKDATTSSVASAAHKLQEKIEELKIDNGTTFLKGGSDFKLGTFVVESGANNSLSSSQTSKVPSRVSRNCTSSKLQDEMRKFSVNATANNVCLEETNKSVLGKKGDANGVIFGTANCSSGYSGESGVRTIYTDSKTADSSGRVDQVFAPGGLASYASGSSNTLHSAKEDLGCRFAALQTDDSCGCSAETAPCTSFPVFQSSTTDFIFTGLHTGIESPRTDFRNQKQDASWLTRENTFTKPYKKMTFDMKKGNSNGVRLKKKRAKSRQSPPSHPGIAKQFVSENNVLEEILEQDAFGGYSPMDYSPYQESLVSNQCSREASIAADVSIHFDSRYTSTGTRISASVDGNDEELVNETVHYDTNEDLPENEANCSKIPFERHLTSECSLADEIASGLLKGCLMEKDENVGYGIQLRSSSMESESFSFCSSIKQPTTEGENGFTFTSPSKDVGQSNFLFAATSSVQSPLSASNHSYQSKIRVKGGQDSHPKTKVPLVSTPNLFLFPNAPVAAGHVLEQKGSYEDKGPGKVNDTNANRESKATAAASDAAQEACEKWRLRGNQAYEDGNFSKAEDYYTLGVKSVSMNEISKNCSRALMLCYSNRAATRMYLVRLREALGDCKMALEIDPNFLRAQVRAGNIHLSLGESRDALQHFEMCLHLDNETKSQKILLEAADGLQKTQKLKDLMDQSSVLSTKSTSSDVSKALEIIAEALFISPYSESLLEMKAETLLMLRNYEEAIRLCERTLELAEKNAVIIKADCQLKDINMQSLERSYVRLWRWRIISRSYFYLGKLDEANELLQKHEKEKPVIEKCGNRYPETSALFPNILRELLRLKNAGNEAFQAGRHLEAVELYTAALALNTESHPFTAVCFCNRAAAYQALGQITDAIADCSIAIALDSSYRKAISRRASLHEMIRDYGQAATDLHKLISLLEKDSEDDRSISNISDLNQTCMRLSTVEEEARKGATLDMYMILGIEKSSSAAEVRKVYRKAALRHHPDKAVQFLARSENGDDNIWREVAEEVHTDADKLFKMIGEAYAILVDPPKRLQYDAEQELRTMKKGYGGSSSPRTPASSFNSRYKSSSDRHPQPT